MEKQKSLVPSRHYFEDELARQREMEALIPNRKVAVKNLPVSHIKPNPFQVRRRFRDLDKLTEAVRVHGFESCLLWVRPDPTHTDYFQLVFGERWLHAARNAGLKMVPCEIATYSDDELFEIGILENIRQHDLDTLEEAFVFRNLVEQRGYSLQQLAQRIGKDERHIIGRLALLAPVENRQHGASKQPAYRPAPPDRPIKIHTTTTREPFQVSDNGDVSVRPDDAAHDRGNTQTRRVGEYNARLGTGSVRRTVERDMGTLREILSRWHGVIDHSSAEYLVMADYCAELLAEVEHLNRRIQSPAEDTT